MAFRPVSMAIYAATRNKGMVHVLKRLGGKMNSVAGRFGLSWRPLVTTNIAVLRVSKDASEIQKAVKHLLNSGRERALVAVAGYEAQGYQNKVTAELNKVLAIVDAEERGKAICNLSETIANTSIFSRTLEDACRKAYQGAFERAQKLAYFKEKLIKAAEAPESSFSQINKVILEMSGQHVSREDMSLVFKDAGVKHPRLNK